MHKTNQTDRIQCIVYKYFILFFSGSNEVIERLDEGLVLASFVVLWWVPIDRAEAS